MATKESWEKFNRNHSRGELVAGSISKITDFGLLIDLEPDIFGIVHLNDLHESNSGAAELAKYSVGETVNTIILSIEPEKERVCLGIKQLRSGPDHDSDNAPPDSPSPVRPRSPVSPKLESEATKNE